MQFAERITLGLQAYIEDIKEASISSKDWFMKSAEE